MLVYEQPAPPSTVKRPVLLIANSSWYLQHYRQLLVEQLKNLGHYVLGLSPVDSATPELSQRLIHIPWRIHRSTDANLFSLGISFLRMLFLVRATKPCLVHSHTLKANLLAVVVTGVFGVPCVLSFAGMGRLSKAVGPSRTAFLLVLRTIAFFAARQRRTRWRWRLAPCRTALIFQNPVDLRLFQAALPKFPTCQVYLIPGSGVPARYFQPRPVAPPLRTYWQPAAEAPHCELLFCGRLLRSKGIYTFLDLVAHLDSHRFTVFGGIDLSSKDSLSSADLSALQHHYPNVTFAGNQADPLLHIHSGFPVLLVPSNYGEGLPRAVVEALALGVPVISSKAAACGIFSEPTVYIADADAPGDYLHCFDRLLADHGSGQLQPRLDAGHRLVKQYLSETAVVQKTIGVYQALQVKQAESYLLSKDDAKLKHWLAQ